MLCVQSLFMEEQVTHSSISTPKTPVVLDQALAYANSNNNHNDHDSAMASHHEGQGATILMGSEERVKKKRGRPRKYDDAANGNCMQLTTTSNSIKRSRGRPRGSTTRHHTFTSMGNLIFLWVMDLWSRVNMNRLGY